MITVLAGVAEFEADMIRERQLEGIVVAKERGVYKGRPRTYGASHKGLQHVLKLFEERGQTKITVAEICEITKISKSALYRFIEKK